MTAHEGSTAPTPYSNVQGHPLQHVTQTLLDRASATLSEWVADGSTTIYDEDDREALAHSLLAMALGERASKEREEGRREAVGALANFIQDSDVSLHGMDQDDVAAWFMHIVHRYLQSVNGTPCECDIDHFDGDVNAEWCDWYGVHENRQQLYLDWVGMSEEELQAKQQAEKEAREREEVARAERLREHRRRELHRLAEEFEVDPRLLP